MTIDRPAVKANQITEEITLDYDVLTNLQLSTALVEDDWYALQQEVLSIFHFCHLHNQFEDSYCSCPLASLTVQNFFRILLYALHFLD